MVASERKDVRFSFLSFSRMTTPYSSRPISQSPIEISPVRHQLPFAPAVLLADTTRQEGALWSGSAPPLKGQANAAQETRNRGRRAACNSLHSRRGNRQDGKTGGTLNVDLTTNIDYTDPALSYLSPGWELEYATCLKLMNYPDGMGPKTSQLVPEAAAGFPKVSNNGKTYDFTVSAGFTRFSDGSKVTTASFKAAFDRNADPKMQSPAGASSRSGA